MSKIKIFSLGGLDENGKNTYIVEVDDSIFVFDCGLKYVSGNLLGIDYVIPDFDYLVNNKDRIKGVFLTHGHYENMGSIPDLLDNIPDIPVYATKFTKYVLVEDGVDESKITEIKPHRKINFDNDISVFPISVSHSSPDSVMYVLNTADGAICYTGDFIIDPSMNGSYDMDIGKIAYVGKQGVLCLLSESVFSEKIGHTSPNHHMVSFFRECLKKENKRIIFLVLPTHLYTIDGIFTAAKNSHRKIVIMGKRLQNMVNFGLENNYLDIQEGLLGDLSNVDDDNSILLICDDRANQYASISKILGGYDKYIKLRKTDTVVFSEPRYDSTEKMIVKIQNDLAMYGCKSIDVPKDKSILHHASSEDLMLMLKLINPKYFMPVKGEYRYLVGAANLASNLKIPKENILLKQNGDVVTFEDGELIDNFEHIKVNDVLIDGKSSDDVGELVIKDREMLSENGIVLISATVAKNEKILLVGPEVVTRGFVYVKDSAEMIEEIRNICEVIIERNITPTYVDYNKIKNEIREELSRYLYSETGCKPMIIAVVQEV